MAQVLTPSDVQSQIDQAKQDEQELASVTAPVGTFTPKAIKALAATVNEAAKKLLGVEPIEVQIPVPEGRTKTLPAIPAELVRPIQAFGQLAGDAVAVDICDEDHLFTLEDIVDDTSAALVAGKIRYLANDKRVAKWIKQELPA